MRRAKIILGIFFLLIGLSTAGTSVYLLQDDRLNDIITAGQDIRTELILLLIFSILLSYSGISTIRKEFKQDKLKQSDLLDD
jgi:uncharacterized membrane protein YbhN (UPF0104 family)